jgi:uncharacterized protein HemX
MEMEGNALAHWGLLGLNLVFAALAYVARLQMKVSTQDLREYVQKTLEEHDTNADAHNNHGLSRDLERKFNSVMDRFNTLNTKLEVLTERLEIRTKR